MATFRKRGDKWQARVQRKGQPDLSKSFLLKADAESWARQLESEIDRGVFQDRSEAERTTFGDLLDRYAKEVTPLKKSAASEGQRINRFIREDKIARYKTTALSGKLIAEWRDKRLLAVSGSTVNRELNLISHVINTARKEWGIHISNPVELIRRPKENRGRERRLSADEEKRLLAELELTCRSESGAYTAGGTHNPWIKPIVVFAIETGMRRGEILSLTWDRVDLRKRIARLVDSKNGEGRSVPLTLKATALLAALPRSIDGRVFATTNDAVKLAFVRAVERAKIDDLHFHDLRHEAVSRLFEKGLNVMEVASISGHKTLQMLKRYTHLSSECLLSKIG